MKDPKFTDEEVIQALKCCADKTSDCCAACPCQAKGLNEGPDCIPAVCQAALDLINRQKAEVAREIFEKLKSYILAHCYLVNDDTDAIWKHIAKLEKKYTEEKTDGSM